MRAVGDHHPTEVRRLEDGADLAAALALREQVFCGEQGVGLDVERDGRDGIARHLGAFAPGGELIGTCRLLDDGAGTVVVGRVAVHAGHRRRGIGRALIDAAVAEARRMGAGAVSLHAQLESEDFYAGQGFTRRGRPFFEAGIEHVTMRREPLS
ncbi:MAG TPA: GNAT family N-acetyltransferase [Solirubrobacteraceae bacterium]|nr:GNAT family N-acetyltransferase [Solirubrobacteraceae bacterium]